MSAARERHAEHGISLLEVLVAIVVLGIALGSLGTLTFATARESVGVSQASHQAAALTREAGRLAVVPFDSLPMEAGCRKIDVSPFPHERCIAIDEATLTLRRVTLIIIPASPHNGPDTTTIERTRPRAGNPFNRWAVSP